MPILELKKEYNKLLMRGLNGYLYLEDDSKPFEKREQWLPEYIRIKDKLHEIEQELLDNGIRMTDDEILGGFNLEEGDNE